MALPHQGKNTHAFRAWRQDNKEKNRFQASIVSSQWLAVSGQQSVARKKQLS
ncbi:hypothetical protein [Coleofasciculus sp. FACHB-1120]|uniref:hypothetical protein n=1 Tax=Coleofasciculus sp. FACHB-1120 TaxID=2692783 RepID=UPI001686E80F|nr:hypothetical protein [Coleofasciculus sp. FACHB-1120]